ncbi:murein biosynthesis integral membrane protein MurJ [Rossellomorea sp. KS-H15a]|uniref:murein biosynthesis integral membrane protein MurJ n=1 Tax=Rossellomorea sp. KS-H15a TaxID=2963940 RepID=UPI0020C5BAF2|nr:murein biosynthesis integral membrane protein MurJ [Rossellomorea sp. KS-H15a]UTE77345.1 murein biosynthesis integral membrane protein MurJ [Rossellomorea sp. KS-H15a]
MKGKSILKIVGAVAVINLLSRLVGFFREVLIGYHFGTSLEADSVVAAYTIPNFLYIAAGGAISTAFISVYSKTEERLQPAFRQVVFTYSAVVFLIVSFIFFLLPQWWIDLVFWGMPNQGKVVTADLFRVMGFSTIFLVLSMLFTGILNTHNQFKTSAIGPLINNVLFVVFAGVFYYSIGIESYSYGALIGSILMFGILAASTYKGKLILPKFQWSMPEKGYIRRFILIALPILFGGATLQFYFLIHRIFAAQLEDGAIAALNYSSKFVQLPQTILMTAVTTVIYPYIAKTIALKRYEQLNSILNRGISMLVLIMVPSTIFVYFYSEELIGILFEYGQFDSRSTIMTAKLLKILVIGMLAHAMNVYLTRFFYAMERPTSSILTGLLSVFGVNVVITVLFIDKFGASAIAWATTISAYVQTILLIILIMSRLNLKISNYFEYIKVVLMALVLVMFTVLMKDIMEKIDVLFIEVIAAGVLFTGFTIFLAAFLKISEVQTIINKKRRTRR